MMDKLETKSDKRRLGILLIVIGAIIAVLGSVPSMILMDEYNRCLEDCFVSCTWCSLDYLANDLRPRMDLWQILMYVFMVVGAVIAIIGLRKYNNTASRAIQCILFFYTFIISIWILILVF
ncbi:MAG: hypothetical protein ACFFCS_23420 [Candidatus Hodarchaeota archaeon]